MLLLLKMLKRIKGISIILTKFLLHYFVYDHLLTSKYYKANIALLATTNHVKIFFKMQAEFCLLDSK